jgi:enolase
VVTRRRRSYKGASVFKAVANVNDVIKPALLVRCSTFWLGP